MCCRVRRGSLYCLIRGDIVWGLSFIIDGNLFITWLPIMCTLFGKSPGDLAQTIDIDGRHCVCVCVCVYVSVYVYVYVCQSVILSNLNPVSW